MVRGKINKSEEKEKKALFVQRLVAFLIDIVLVSLIASFISAPFINTDKTSDLEKKTYKLVEQLKKNEISIEEYSVQYKTLYYKMARNSGVSSLIIILLNVLYFVVYQIYNNGQTIGKRFTKIRIVSDDGELSYDQLIFRSFIANFILVDIIMFIFMLFGTKDIYFWSTFIFRGIQYLVVFISVIMVMNHNDGRAIHDKLVHTKVIREK